MDHDPLCMNQVDEETARFILETYPDPNKCPQCVYNKRVRKDERDRIAKRVEKAWENMPAVQDFKAGTILVEAVYSNQRV
jgi:hypothetical protein